MEESFFDIIFNSILDVFLAFWDPFLDEFFVVGLGCRGGCFRIFVFIFGYGVHFSHL